MRHVAVSSMHSPQAWHELEPAAIIMRASWTDSSARLRSRPSTPIARECCSRSLLLPVAVPPVDTCLQSYAWHVEERRRHAGSMAVVACHWQPAEWQLEVTRIAARATHGVARPATLKSPLACHARRSVFAQSPNSRIVSYYPGIHIDRYRYRYRYQLIPG